MNTKTKIGKAFVYLFAAIWLLVATVPLILAVLSSFKDNAEIYRRPWQLPESWALDNYLSAIDVGVLSAVGNTLMVSLLTAGGVLLVALLASYAMSRKNIRWVKSSYTLFVIAVMIPVHTTLIPISTLSNALNAKDQYWYLILVYIAFNMAQSIFLISGFMNGISRDIDDAAIIDGCGEMRLLFQILTPICKPILATEAIFAFVYAYGELIFSLTLIAKRDLYTVSRAMLSFYGDGDLKLGPIFAFIVITAIPSMLIYVLFHKQIQKGVMSGAVKG